MFLASGRPDRAVALLEGAATRGIATPELQGRLGSAYLAAGNAPSAVAVLEPIARPELAGGLEAMNTLAVALTGQRRFDRARQLLSAVLEHSPRSATTWSNLGTGDLTLSGGVANSGSINFNGAGAGCPQTDEILIRSSVNRTQRAWSGLGAFSLTDVDVQDQAGSAIISVRSGANSDNNGLNWLFVAQCNAYTWTGAISTDWTNPLNWSPSRTAAATDILYFSAGTPSPIVTNVVGATGGNTETIAELHVDSGVMPTFSSGGANTLAINAGAGNIGLDVSNLAVTGANALTIRLASGTLGSVSGTMSFADGGHRLIGQAAGAISFGGVSVFSTQSGFTGNAFGDGSSAANGAGSASRWSAPTSISADAGSPLAHTSSTLSPNGTTSSARLCKMMVCAGAVRAAAAGTASRPRRTP